MASVRGNLLALLYLYANNSLLVITFEKKRRLELKHMLNLCPNVLLLVIHLSADWSNIRMTSGMHELKD